MSPEGMPTMTTTSSHYYHGVEALSHRIQNSKGRPLTGSQHSSRRHKQLSSSANKLWAITKTQLLLFVAACCAAQLFWTSKSFAQRFSSQMIVQGDEIKIDERNNTNWRNVQYHSGVFGQGHLPWEEEHHINMQCIHLSGYSYSGLPSENNNSLCWGPLPTNTTCCYCFISRDYEELGFIEIYKEYKYWSCAVERNHSLLPLNATPVNAQGRQVAWFTGRFGHGDYFKNEVDAYCQQVRELNFFESQHTYCYWDSPDYVLQNPKFSRHLRYRTDPKDLSAKGGGFWFHKSVILRHLLDVYNEGDCLVYTDIDRIDFFRLGTFHAVLETMAKRGDDLSIDVIGNAREGSDTKEDVLAAFNASNITRASPQVNANVIVIRNTPKMKRFLDAWIDCVSDWHMVSDEPSILPNGPQFLDHRHDQSILSLLIKRFMTVQVVVGPPARPYAFLCELLTFRFTSEMEPSCPFPAFYANQINGNVNNTKS